MAAEAVPYIVIYQAETDEDGPAPSPPDGEIPGSDAAGWSVQLFAGTGNADAVDLDEEYQPGTTRLYVQGVRWIRRQDSTVSPIDKWQYREEPNDSGEWKRIRPRRPLPSHATCLVEYRAP